MRRRHLFAVVAAVGIALGVVAFAAARPAATKLQGTVGQGFTISLKSGGKTVKTLKAGTYSFVINDKANIHNFVVERQTGVKVEKTLTGVGFQGTKTVSMKLTKGKWKYYCQPHESQIFGFFTVT